MNENGITCDVAKDLMPLCADGVASADSRALVDAHVASCASCAEEMRAMQEDATARAPADMPLSKAWRGFAGALRRSHGFWIVTGALIAALVIAAGLRGWDMLTLEGNRPIPLANLAVENIRVTDSGVLLYDVRTLDGTRLIGCTAGADEKDGALYISYVSPTLPLKDEKNCAFSMEHWLYIENGTAYADWEFGTEDRCAVTALRLGTPEKYVSVWEPGDTPALETNAETNEEFADALLHPVVDG